MDISSYYDLISNERKACRYLSKKCLKNGHRICPRCGYRKPYKLRDGRRRCARCKYTFHDFSGRWINHGRLSCIQWLSIIKLFELEASTRKIASQVGISYNTAYRAVQTIRYAILAHSDENGFTLLVIRGRKSYWTNPISGDAVRGREVEGLREKFLFSVSWSVMEKSRFRW